ncbi:hypothetical protein EV378_5354 [Pseudonocardia endophytica]|uniref:Uncharacterized protein n=1 Tax=Pseudonocardia endophytica TaxID=401976 RepID=A0A4R1HV82_PSEEN|nr:hypothetical protein EV378_5354 [Pseudonocardia endophytica]
MGTLRRLWLTLLLALTIFVALTTIAYVTGLLG